MDTLVPVLTAVQMRDCDNKTIQNEPISSIALMERAARRVYNVLQKFIGGEQRILVLCGPGNNGGDGLAIGRMLISDGYQTQIALCTFGKEASTENIFQESLLGQFRPDALSKPNNAADIDLLQTDIIVDCLFGTGMRTELEGEFLNLVQKINNSGKQVYSVDMPSGLLDQKAQEYGSFVHCSCALAIQAPKTSFFYPENKISFVVIDVGIQIGEIDIMHFFMSPEPIWKEKLEKSWPSKPIFGHKGDNGHVLLVGGNVGMHGAITLAAESCISEGAGLTTVWSPAGSRLYMARLPKAMHIAASLSSKSLSKITLEKFSTLVIGPGLNTQRESTYLLQDLLSNWNKPALLDADALNILANNRSFWPLVKPGSILTPHPGEFKRLFGEYSSGYDIIEIGRKMAMEKEIYIVAKNKYTHIFCPNGEIITNGSGDENKAQGGSGDQLTGHIAAWWARTGQAKTACMAGVFRAGWY